MDGIGKISSIVEAAGKVAAPRPVGPVSRDNPEKPGSAIRPDVVPAPQAQAKEDPLRRASAALADLFSERFNSKLQIDLDRAAGRFVLRSIDAESGEVLRQFPAEEMLRILSYYRNEAGLVVDDKA